MIFASGKAIFRDANGKEVLVGRGTNRMYLLNDLHNAYNSTVMIATPLNALVDLDGWHWHFGHARVDRIRKAI